MAKVYVVLNNEVGQMIAFPTEAKAKEAIRAYDGTYIVSLVNVTPNREDLCNFFNKQISPEVVERRTTYTVEGGRAREQK